MINLTQIKRFFIADLTTTRDPFSLGRWDEPIDDAVSPKATPVQKLPPAFEGELRDVPLSCSMDTNITHFKQQFKLPTSQGLIIHRVQVPLDPPVEAAVIYIAGMADTTHVSNYVLKPLLGEGGLTILPSTPKEMLHGLFPEGQSYVRTEFYEVVLDLMEGGVAVLIDGEAGVTTMRAEGWRKRSIGPAKTEVTVRGPSEAFVEDIRTNLSQVRRRLRTEEFMIELGHLGRLSRTDIALLYIKNITNDRLVNEARRRLAGVDVDYINDAGSLAQYIEDHPNAIYPTVLVTERPDRVATHLAQGFVAVLIENDAHALIMPTTITALLHSAEDAYLHWPAGTFMRLTRVLSYYVAMLLPGAYLALANYRQEMIPTPLLLAIAQTRETVPFSTVIEVLFMECSFELIHEATLRVPTVVGPTIGIVGTLILGQAAVQAGIISPILVIITAATALASFAIPTYELQMSVRMWRFTYIAAAAVMGMAGVIMLHTMHVANLAAMNSFGAPYLAPTTPFQRKGDNLVRAPAFQLDKRPELVRAKHVSQQDEITRPWTGEPAAPPPSPKGGKPKS